MIWSDPLADCMLEDRVKEMCDPVGWLADAVSLLACLPGLAELLIAILSSKFAQLQAQQPKKRNRRPRKKRGQKPMLRQDTDDEKYQVWAGLNSEARATCTATA